MLFRSSADGAAAELLNLYRRHAAAVFKVITDAMAMHAPEIASGSVPSSCLLILALPEEYRRPATFVGDATVPVLALDEIKDGEANSGLLARIVGHERFDGVSKKIGVRELFFVALLFGSTRTHNFAGRIITVTPESDVSQELLKWSEARHMRFEIGRAHV